MPNFLLVAGPNGAGKSTLTASALLQPGTTIVDPDAIARQLNPAEPEKAAIAAARTAIQSCRELLAARADFVLESTLSGHNQRRFSATHANWDMTLS